MRDSKLRISLKSKQKKAWRQLKWNIYYKLNFVCHELTKIEMRIQTIIIFSAFLTLSGCLNLDEEPIMFINPTATLSANIMDQKIFATSLINVNPQVLVAGNVPMIFEFTGDLSIYNTINGTIIDINSFSGGGLSQVYTVSADTVGHDRFIVIASGNIKAYSDLDKNGKISSSNLLSEGDFYQETQFIVSELVNYE